MLLTCIEGNVTPPPIPSRTRIKITTEMCSIAEGGVNNVPNTLMNTEKNMTHLAEYRSATYKSKI